MYNIFKIVILLCRRYYEVSGGFCGEYHWVKNKDVVRNRRKKEFVFMLVRWPGGSGFIRGQPVKEPMEFTWTFPVTRRKQNLNFWKLSSHRPQPENCSDSRVAPENTHSAKIHRIVAQFSSLPHLLYTKPKCQRKVLQHQMADSHFTMIEGIQCS